MSLAHDRAARRERQAAEVLGSERVHRARFERAPDVKPIRLEDGRVVVPEVKTRKRLPRWLLAALRQAAGYHRDATPLAVVSELGGEPIAVLRLVDLAEMVGLREPKDGAQLLLLGGSR
jgi:hypothetical protein